VNHTITAEEIAFYVRMTKQRLDAVAASVKDQLSGEFPEVDSFSMDALLERQEQHRVWHRLQSLVSGGVTPETALKAVMKELNRTLRDTGTTPSAVSRAMWEARRHVAAQFVEQWDSQS